MKIKFLLAAVCMALPLVAGCSVSGGTDSYAEISIYAKDSPSASGGKQSAAADGSSVTGESTVTDGSDAYSTDDSSVVAVSTAADGSSGIIDSTDEVTVMCITVNSNKLEVTLVQNTSVDALVEILGQGDITYTATDYGNFEKVGDIGHSLPRNDEQITTQAGDVILYLGSNICLYYGTNTWSFTRIGRIEGYSAEQLKELLGAGSGSMEIILSLK